MTDVDNSEDILNADDICERIEELETELQDAHEGEGNGGEFSEWLNDMAENDEGTLQDAAIELKNLSEFMEEFKGYGGDHQWRGDWYPGSFIRDSHFKDYAQELAEDIGAIKGDETWPANCIDWDKAAHQLQMDYTSGEFDGVTYWAR